MRKLPQWKIEEMDWLVKEYPRIPPMLLEILWCCFSDTRYAGWLILSEDNKKDFSSWLIEVAGVSYEQLLRGEQNYGQYPL